MTIKELTAIVDAQAVEITTLKETVEQHCYALDTLTNERMELTLQVEGLQNQIEKLMEQAMDARKQPQVQQRSPEQGGYVPAIGKPHSRGECATHGAINLNRYGCCFHCYNIAVQARSAGKRRGDTDGDTVLIQCP